MSKLYHPSCLFLFLPDPVNVRMAAAIRAARIIINNDPPAEFAIGFDSLVGVKVTDGILVDFVDEGQGVEDGLGV